MLQSWLHKRRPKDFRKRHWDRRFFKVVDDVILYYKDEAAKKLRNRIPIWSIVSIEKMIMDVHQLPAKLKPLYQYGFRIQTADNNDFELLAEDEKTRQMWLDALPELVQKWTAEGPKAKDTTAVHQTLADNPEYRPRTASGMSLASLKSAGTRRGTTSSGGEEAPSYQTTPGTTGDADPEKGGDHDAPRSHGLKLAVDDPEERMRRDATGGATTTHTNHTVNGDGGGGGEESMASAASSDDDASSADEEPPDFASATAAADTGTPVQQRGGGADTSSGDISSDDENDMQIVDEAPDFHTASATVTANAQTIQGFLYKRGQQARLVGVVHNQAWRRRWCVLADGYLQYYERTTDTSPKGRIPVSDMLGVATVTENSKDARPYTFEIRMHSKRNYIFSAESDADLRKWVSFIEGLITVSQKSGFLYKRGGINRAWKSRWFVLRDAKLLYYPQKNATGTAAAKVIDLTRARGIQELDELDVGEDNCFQILCDNRTWTLRAHDEADKLDWISAIRCELPAQNIKKSGYLSKRGELNSKRWRRRWFELSDITLAYYESKETSQFKGSINLRAIQDVVSGSEENHSDAIAFRVICAHRTYELLGDDGQDVADWIDVISQCSRAAQTRPTLSARPALRAVSSDEDDGVDDDDNDEDGAVAGSGVGDGDGGYNDTGGGGERRPGRRKKRMLRRTDTSLPGDEDEENTNSGGNGDAVAAFARGGLRRAGAGASDDELTGDDTSSDDGWEPPRSFVPNHQLQQQQQQQQQQSRRRQPKETLAALSQKRGGGVRRGWGWRGSKRSGSRRRRGNRTRFDDDDSADFDARYEEDPIDLPDAPFSVAESRSSAWANVKAEDLRVEPRAPLASSLARALEEPVDSQDTQQQSQTSEPKLSLEERAQAGALRKTRDATPSSWNTEEITRREQERLSQATAGAPNPGTSGVASPSGNENGGTPNTGTPGSTPTPTAANPGGPETEGKGMTVSSPSLLRVILHSHHNPGGVTDKGPHESVERITLSGCTLHCRNGIWCLAPGSAFHTKPPSTSTHKEEFVLPPGIYAQFLHDCRQWYVTATRPKQSEQTHPVGGQRPAQIVRSDTSTPEEMRFAQLGGLRMIAGVDTAVKTIMEFLCSQSDSGLDPREELQRRSDDSVTATIGVLVRKRLCDALFRILTHGLYKSRMGGFIKVDVWDLFVASNPRPTPSTPQPLRQAYGAMRDLQHNVNMLNDNHVRARSFICAGLNHKFLAPWLFRLYRDKALLTKHFEPKSFLRQCPVMQYEQLVLTLSPLTSVPFRLHTSFEMDHRLRKQRAQRGKGQSAAPVPQHATRNAPAQPDGRQVTDSFPADSREIAEHLGGGAEDGEDDAQPTFVRALFPNDVPDDDAELPFQPGDILTFEAWHPNNEEWCFCSVHGRRGLVPVSYIEVLDEVEAAAHQATQSFFAPSSQAHQHMFGDDVAAFNTQPDPAGPELSAPPSTGNPHADEGDAGAGSGHGADDEVEV